MFTDVLMDFSWIGLLLLVAFWIRSKVTVLQKLYIPVAVIAGLIGLLCGPNVLGKVCPLYIHWSDMLGSYATPLLAILFSVSFLGIKLDKRSVRSVSAVYLIYGVVITLQVLVCLPAIKIFNLPDGFSLLPQAAFYGGHGIPAIVASIYDSFGYWDPTDVVSIGTTFATIGLLWGVIVGVILINYGTRKGWLVSKEGLKQLSREESTGYIEPENRKTFMLGMTDSGTIDPLAFHCAIVGAIMIMGYGLLYLCKQVDLLKNFAITVPVMIVGLIVGAIANRTSLKNVIDRNSLSKIGTTALEFLIASSVATTNLEVITTFGLPILLVTVIALPLTTIVTLVLSKRWLKESWFEHAICMFGAFTGVTATGMMLLRITDPEMKTTAMVDIAAVSPLNSLTLQTFYLQFAPIFIVTAAGAKNTYIGTAVAMVAFFIIGTLVFARKRA